MLVKLHHYLFPCAEVFGLKLPLLMCSQEVLFSNSLRQIAIEPSACTKTPCQLDLQSKS